MIRRGVRVLVVAALAATGGALLAAPQVAPTTVDQATGKARAVWRQIEARVTGQEYPVIRLGGAGGQAELDACDAKWVEQTTYRVDDLQPVYAAHNYCGGDIALDWDTGDLVDVAGRGLHRVTDVKAIPSTARADDLIGLKGELLLQTCFWGSERTRIVALSRMSDGS